jgi:hypothetical protein
VAPCVVNPPGWGSLSYRWGRGGTS